jgi:protocatechuate 3,4-dioxygenase beta subunit
VVVNALCEPIAGARLDFWQADGAGEYDNAGYRLRGHQSTDVDGAYRLETVIPGIYPGRTPHIHVKIFAPDGRELLTTQLYFTSVSEQLPDALFDAALLARDQAPEPDGRRHVSFDFVVRE